MLERPQISLVDLGKVCEHGAVLQALSLEVHRGDFIAIEGAPGSGKTALLSILGLLDTPSAGNYILNGQAVDTLTDLEGAKLRNQTFGLVFQTFAFITQLNAWQNVAKPLVYAGVSKRERQERALALLEQLGLSKCAYTQPLYLSVAEQRRVALARALVNDPEIILADEPTGNLSRAQWEPLLGALGALHTPGKTIILTTRDPEVAARASKRYLLSQGQLHEVKVAPAKRGSRPAHESAYEGLRLCVLGRTQVHYEGRTVSLAPRQVDILTLLAAHPEGLTSEQLLLLVYGDEGKRATLKAMLSRLRQHLPIDNRPYRLGTAYDADFVQLSELLARGDVEAAVKLYRGHLLPESDAPGIRELRETLSETLRQVVLASGDAPALFTLAETHGDDRELWEATLDMLPTDSPRVALAKAQLKRVEKAWGD